MSAWEAIIAPAMALDSHFPAIVRHADRAAQRAVDSAGYRIEAGSKIRARHRTGFMRGEIQWVSGPGDHEGQVVAGANYTIYHEYGTRYMTAQPMLRPALEDARPLFEQDLRDAYRVR